MAEGIFHEAREKLAVKLDTTGKVCPYPALEAIAALKSLPPGGLLELVTNNEATVLRSIPAVCRNFGAAYTVEREGGVWRAFIQKP